MSSKEFTPTMVNAVFENLKLKNPKQNFTVGIDDDVTHLSLNLDNTIKELICREVEGAAYFTYVMCRLPRYPRAQTMSKAFVNYGKGR